MEYDDHNYTTLPPLVKFGPRLRLIRVMQRFLTDVLEPTPLGEGGSTWDAQSGVCSSPPERCGSAHRRRAATNDRFV